jgi:hypothetical protein
MWICVKVKKVVLKANACLEAIIFHRTKFDGYRGLQSKSRTKILLDFCVKRKSQNQRSRSEKEYN